VVIIGAGVVGLSCAVQFLQQGFKDVTVLSKDKSPNTTSDGAGGQWRPFGVATDEEQTKRLQRWGKETWDWLSRIYREHGERTGVAFVSGYELFRKQQPLPFWKDDVIGFREVTQEEIALFVPSTADFLSGAKVESPSGRPPLLYGFFYTTIVVDMARYMSFLQTACEALGCKFVTKEVGSLSEFVSRSKSTASECKEDGDLHADVVINCSGLGARTLVPDPEVYPVRGHILRVHAPSIKHHFAADDEEDNLSPELLYIIPRSQEVVIGGTYQVNNWDLQPAEDEAKAIVARCAEVFPDIANAKILEQWVGLRPGRASVRLELDSSRSDGEARAPVVHNYGHGGSGITLHWGCANVCVKLAAQLFDKEAAEA